MKTENQTFEGRPTFTRSIGNYPNKIALEEAVSTKAFNAVATVPPFPIASELPYTQSVYGHDVENRLEDIDIRIKSMDEAGLALTVLSLTMPGVEGILDPKLAVEYARQVNDEVYSKYLTGAHSDRFRAFASVAMQNPQAAAEEVTRAVKELGMVGVLINGFCNIGDINNVQYLDEPQCEPFWAAIAALDVPVYIHPRIPSPGQMRAFKGWEFLGGSPWGFMIETATHALRLMISGLFDRHPKLKIILGHCGEGLPVSLPRADSRLRHFNHDHYPAKESLMTYWKKNFWVTTAGVFDTNTFNETVNACGPDRVLFSVDYPYESNVEACSWFDGMPLNDRLRSKIGWENAIDLLKL